MADMLNQNSGGEQWTCARCERINLTEEKCPNCDTSWQESDKTWQSRMLNPPNINYQKTKIDFNRLVTSPLLLLILIVIGLVYLIASNASSIFPNFIINTESSKSYETSSIPSSGIGEIKYLTDTPIVLFTSSLQSASELSTPTMLLARSNLWFGQGCSTSYTGPGGIRAGGYPPSSLTQDQRQWLFEVFGNQGIASVGYGGQTCLSQATPTHPAWFGQGCSTSYTGPGGIRAGGYPPTSLTQEQRQWLFEVFGNEGIASVGYGGQSCSWQATPTHPAWFSQGCSTSYTGPGGIRAGGYPPTSLTQEQRQWLFEVFGNEGIASVGYGGQGCPWQEQTVTHPPWFGQGCGTSYTGPGGIIAGGYEPTSLSQDQRQWLFEVFGNEGIASVGYGGQGCP